MKWGHTCQKIPPIVQILHKDVSQGVIFKAWSCLIFYPKTQRKLSFEWDFYRVDLWNHRTSSLIIIDSTRFWTVSCFHHFWAYWTRVLFSIRALSDMYWFYLKAFPWWKSLFLDNKLSAFGKEENYSVLEDIVWIWEMGWSICLVLLVSLASIYWRISKCPLFGLQQTCSVCTCINKQMLTWYLNCNKYS